MAFANHLDRLKEMGVQTVWFMPINPISKKDRKGSLGSYYAVADYTAINPEYGNMEDWKALVKKIHDKGMKVLIDWVPNHTGADHPWLQTHPDFFVKDSTGKAATMFTGTGSLDCRIQRQQVGLIGDIVNDANFLRDLFHRSHRLFHRGATLRGLSRRL